MRKVSRLTPVPFAAERRKKRLPKPTTICSEIGIPLRKMKISTKEFASAEKRKPAIARLITAL